MEKYPKVESKVFRGGAVVGEYLYINFHKMRRKNHYTYCLYTINEALTSDFLGVNPKINNMLPAYRAALHPLILVSDSSIKMKEDSLVDMVAAMTDNVGLVHQMPCE